MIEQSERLRDWLSDCPTLLERSERFLSFYNGLSAREAIIAEMYTDGFTSNRIAAAIDMSDDTVYRHRNLMIKRIGSFAGICEAVFWKRLNSFRHGDDK